MEDNTTEIVSDNPRKLILHSIFMPWMLYLEYIHAIPMQATQLEVTGIIRHHRRFLC